jgi:hypothetical protein
MTIHDIINVRIENNFENLKDITLVSLETLVLIRCDVAYYVNSISAAIV